MASDLDIGFEMNLTFSDQNIIYIIATYSKKNIL